ncbi:MAG: asparagine synthase (glutamine-hydrolyzing) [Nitrospinae bacterium]|nr:asparagine synthase (glutamine-hydrolyzing) [Nitrospinota bacterium]
MCGVTALISQDEADHSLFAQATDLLAHRGPDSRGVKRDGPVALGHRRLAIIDLSPAGAQPMTNETGDVWLVCNGEIYNYVDLNRQLKSRGHVFRSHSDSETLIHLYEEYGESFLEHVNGMFAFALWDGRRKKLIAAVDRFGKKPLYYAGAGEKLAMASELKSLLLFPWVGRDIDPNAVDRYLSLRYVPAPMTILKSAKKLEPATMLVWEGEKVSIRRYWNPAKPGPIAYDSETVDRFESLFSDAVKIRLQSDVPLGVYLSGGVDSAAVAGMMRRLSEGRRISYTLSVDYKYDERERAQKIAGHLGFEFNPVTVDSADFDLLPEIAYHLDEPFGDMLCLPSYLLAREAKRKLTVVLTGDGADEILNGYFHQRLMEKRRRMGFLLNAPFMGSALSSAINAAPLAVLNYFFDYPDRIGQRERLKISHMLEGCGSFGGFYEGITSCFTAQDKKNALTGSFRKSVSAAPWSEEIEREWAGIDGFSFYSALSVLDLKYWIPFSVVYRLDKLNMAHAVETRSPFLDYRVVEMALSLEDAGKIHGKRNKVILRKLIERLYPPELREKGKQAFYMPVTGENRKRFRNWAATLLDRKRMEQRGLFRPLYIEGLFTAYDSGSMLATRQLTALAMLELWFDKFAATGRQP